MFTLTPHMVPVAAPLGVPTPGSTVWLVGDTSGLSSTTADLLTTAGVRVSEFNVHQTLAHPYRSGVPVVGAESLARYLDDLDQPEAVVYTPAFCPGTGTTHPAEVALLSGQATTLRVLTQYLARWWERGGGPRLVCATRLGQFGAEPEPDARLSGGLLTGLTRSLSVEFPHLSSTVLDLSPSVDLPAAAGHLVAAAASDRAQHEEFAITAGGVLTQELRHAFRTPDAVAGPSADWPVSDGDTVLATGGARGITARILISLASSVRCRFIVVGTTQPIDVLAALGVSDREAVLTMPAQTLHEHKMKQFSSMRKVRPGLTPVAFERRWGEIERSIEIVRSVTRLRELGSVVDYRQLDLTDYHSTRRFAQEVRTEGPVTALYHGAAVEHSCQLSRKTAHTWDRTVATKAAALSHLRPVLDENTRLVMLFSSISGTFGGPGQTDYAAACSYLSTAAHFLDRELPGSRVRCVAWPAWDGAGMAIRSTSRASLEERGIEFMSIDEGIRWADALARTHRRLPETVFGFDAMVDEARPTRAVVPWAPTVDRLRFIDDVAGDDTVRWVFDPERDQVLLDHVVASRVRVPFVMFLELVCEAAETLTGEHPLAWRLQDVRLESPLVLAPDRRRTIEVTLAPLDGPAWEATVSSRAVLPSGVEVTQRIRHARALVRAAAPDAQRLTLPHPEDWPATGPHDLIAARLAGGGIEHGPAFCGMTSHRLHGNVVVARADAARAWSAGADPQWSSVPLLDLALQSAALLGGTHQVGLPTGVDEAVIGRFSGVTSTVSVCAPAGDSRLSFLITDPTGRQLAVVHGLRTAGLVG
jgi:hypothetical protein